MSASSWVHLDVERVFAATDEALLLIIDGQQYWFPRSQIADADQYEVGDEDVTISVSSWIAGKKGLGE